MSYASESKHRKEHARRRYRELNPIVKQRHAAHRCSICCSTEHVATRCTRCVECARPGEFLNNRGRLCQRCLEMAA